MTVFTLQILTKDSVTVAVDGVVYFRIHCPISSVANVTNAHTSTRLLAQTTLRNVLGTKNLAELLSDREGISHSMQVRMMTPSSQKALITGYFAFSVPVTGMI